jgi:hypothetical protein
MPGTAEEDEDAAGRARRAAGRAGSLEVMPSSQGSRVLPARMRFPIRRRYVADRSVREHVTGHRRPLRHPGMIPLSLREIAAAVGRTVEGDSGARRRQASDQPWPCRCRRTLGRPPRGRSLPAGHEGASEPGRSALAGCRVAPRYGMASSANHRRWFTAVARPSRTSDCTHWSASSAAPPWAASGIRRLAGYAACGNGLIPEPLGQDDGVRRLRG